MYNLFRYYGYTKEVSTLFTKICTYDGSLPQGAPTSPYLANLICKKLDKRLSKLASLIDATYTRYADDITFSGSHKILSYIPVIQKIILNEGFTVNEKKTRAINKSNRQIVTGLVVNNDSVKVQSKYKKVLRQHIYYCKKFGVDYHLSHRDGNEKSANFKEYLFGMAYFIKMVRGYWEQVSQSTF